MEMLSFGSNGISDLLAFTRERERERESPTIACSGWYSPFVKWWNSLSLSLS
jgi:hypothetical protein